MLKSGIRFFVTQDKTKPDSSRNRAVHCFLKVTNKFAEASLTGYAKNQITVGTLFPFQFKLQAVFSSKFSSSYETLFSKSVKLQGHFFQFSSSYNRYASF
ncbi:hypothetical protein GCM10028805_55410 [Spirosoma harenae]